MLGGAGGREGLMTQLNGEQYGERGRGLLEGKRPAEALQAFQEGLAKFPKDHDLGVGRGFALLDLKRPASAKEQFAAVLAAKPDFGDAGQGMVEACLALGHGVEAILAGRAAVPHEERNGDFIHGLGHIFFRYKRYEQAEWFYRQALERAPFHPPATLGLATSIHQQGRAEEAIVILKEALDKGLKRFWEGYSYLGCLLFDAGRTKEAYELLRRIPLDELRDPAAIERLRGFLNGSRYRRRVKVLNFLADRARQARGEPKREKRPKKLVDDAPLWPQDGFWQSRPTLIASRDALELDGLFARHFDRPCKFDGVDFPKFKLAPALEDCLQALELLAAFFESYPWVPEGGAGHARQWQAAGAESLMAYTLAMLRKGKAYLKGQEAVKFKARQLMIAMSAIAETAPLGGRIHGNYYYLFKEINQYTG